MVAITGTELQEWVEHMSRGWKNLLESHPEILSFPCDIRETTSVAQLLQHIVAVELRYAESLNELAQTPYESIPYDSVDAIYATHGRAMDLLRPLMDRDEPFWEAVPEFKTRSAGTLRAIASHGAGALAHTLCPALRPACHAGSNTESPQAWRWTTSSCTLSHPQSDWLGLARP